MSTQELIEALRNKESRDNRALLDEAAERLYDLEKIADFYCKETKKLYDRIIDLQYQLQAEERR